MALLSAPRGRRRTGVPTLQDRTRNVGPGGAIPTRNGDSHALKQDGAGGRPAARP